jgi:hypothetical protein
MWVEGIAPLRESNALPKGTTHAPHPYKAYMYRPGSNHYWQKGASSMIFIKNGMPYDFGVLNDGIFFDVFGHGVLPEDADINHRVKKENEYRILFLGGSTTFQPWPFLTAEILSAQTSLEVRAISAGTGGYTSQENIIDLITSGFSYSPDMVISYLPINDILHPARWPSFRRDYSHFRTALTAEVKNPDTAKPENHILIYPFIFRLIQTATMEPCKLLLITFMI